MDILLAGTGPATGFPVPGCGCATCSTAADGGLIARRPAGLHLSGWTVDVDCGLRGPDGSRHRPAPGERLRADGLEVHAFGDGQDAATLALLIQHRSQAILWAPQAGALNDSLLSELAEVCGLTGNAGPTGNADPSGHPDRTERAGPSAALAAVFLGPSPEQDPAAPADPAVASALLTSAWGVGRLRARGLVTAGTRCLLLGLGHRQGPGEVLAACLAHWGAQAPSDGTRLRLWSIQNDDSPTPSMTAARAPGGRTLVLGGSASGKSVLAEQLMAAWPHVLYTATGPMLDLRTDPDDDWSRRVRRHRERRPSWWQTAETSQVAALLRKADQPVLLDSIGTWLTGVLDQCGAWQDRPGWREQLSAQTGELLRAWRARTAPLVAVTEEVGWGVVPATASGRLFRDELGLLNRRLTQESERLLVVVAGRLMTTPPPGPR